MTKDNTEALVALDKLRDKMQAEGVYGVKSWGLLETIRAALEKPAIDVEWLAGLKKEPPKQTDLKFINQGRFDEYKFHEEILVIDTHNAAIDEVIRRLMINALR